MGEAYRFLLDLRLDEGPLGPEEYEAAQSVVVCALRAREARTPVSPELFADQEICAARR